MNYALFDGRLSNAVTSHQALGTSAVASSGACRSWCAAIQGYVNHHNQNPKVFVWTAPVERIRAKVAKCKEVLGALH